MSRAPRVTDSASDPASAGSAPEPPTDPNREYHICPFCGLTREINLDFDPSEACPRCTLTDSPTTRNATKARIGPWHVRQVRNPWAPGMRFETLLSLIKHGQVNAESIVRGPTTHQLWKRAANVRGLSREFGLCFSCAAEIDTQASLCPHCNRLQDPPANPDLLVDVRETIPPVAEKVVEKPAEEQVQLPLEAPAPKPVTAPPPMKQTAKPQAAPVAKAPPAPVHREDDADQPAGIDIGASAPAPGSASSRDPLAADEKADEREQDGQRPPPSRPRPLRPRVPGADDALLTPQELAQAFQLDFAPAPTPRKPRMTKAWTWAIFLLLVVGGTALLLHFRPDYRAQAAQWSSKKAETVKTFVASRTNPAPGNAKTPAGNVSAKAQAGGNAAGSTAAAPTTQPKPGPIAIAPPPAPAPAPAHKVEPEPPAPPVEEVVITPAPTPRPIQTRVIPPVPPPVTSSPPVVATPPPASPAHPPAVAVAPAPVPSPMISPAPATKPATERVAAAPATRPAEVVAFHPPPAPTQPPPPEPAPATAKPSAVQLPAGDPETQARTLWRQAIDAEANQDFLEAVQCYDLIKKLPEDVQPPGIDVRLKMARKQLK